MLKQPYCNFRGQFILTADKNSWQVRCDVPCDSKSVPRVNGAIGENYPGGADVVAPIVLIGTGHGLCQLFGTDVVEVCALFHMVTGRENKRAQK